MKINATYDEAELILEALQRLLIDKEDAYATCQGAGLRFTPRDFGIPQLQGLVAEVEAKLEIEDQS